MSPITLARGMVSITHYDEGSVIFILLRILKAPMKSPSKAQVNDLVGALPHIRTSMDCPLKFNDNMTIDPVLG